MQKVYWIGVLDAKLANEKYQVMCLGESYIEIKIVSFVIFGKRTTFEELKQYGQREYKREAETSFF